MKYLIMLISLFMPIQFGLCEQGDSLFDIPLKWINDQGEPFMLSALRGKPTVVSMLYTQCKSACPVTINRLRTIEDKLGSDASNVHFLLVTLDPGRDGAPELKQFREGHKINRPNWFLLTGSESEVRKFSVLIGYSFQKDTATKEILHSNKILVLNKDGEISFSLEGLASDESEIVTSVKGLLSKDSH